MGKFFFLQAKNRQKGGKTHGNRLDLLIQRATEKCVSRSIFVHMTQRRRIRIALNFSCRLVPFVALFEKKSGFQIPPNPFSPLFSL